jgi:serine/threonine-protein kinase
METFDRYRIIDRIGADALGELLRARDTRVGRTVALRIVSPLVAGDPARRRALLADASAARALSHPNAAALFDAGECDGRVFLAHEYVAGRPLRDYMMGTPLSADRAIEFAIHLADGVAEGHRLGLVHGALDPSTVFITAKDKTKVVDFGIAGWTEAELSRRAIAAQLAAGGPVTEPGAGDVVHWMAPEQILCGRADCRSDVFSLGALVYLMATGRNPFAARAPEEAALKVLTVAAARPSAANPALPARLDAVLARAMAKSPAARYGSAVDMADDLRALNGRKPAAFSPRFR